MSNDSINIVKQMLAQDGLPYIQDALYGMPPEMPPQKDEAVISQPVADKISISYQNQKEEPIITYEKPKPVVKEPVVKEPVVKEPVVSSSQPPSFAGEPAKEEVKSLKINSSLSIPKLFLEKTEKPSPDSIQEKETGNILNSKQENVHKAIEIVDHAVQELFVSHSNPYSSLSPNHFKEDNLENENSFDPSRITIETQRTTDKLEETIKTLKIDKSELDQPLKEYFSYLMDMISRSGYATSNSLSIADSIKNSLFEKLDL